MKVYCNRELIGFFLSGIINNSVWVLINASAKDLDGIDAVGLVFAVNTIPVLFVKFFGPTFFFHKISYHFRFILTGLFMFASLLFVAFGNAPLILFGIACSSFSSGLGEASMLASTSLSTSPNKSITAWASGTGFAGIIGVGWRLLWVNVAGLSFRDTLLLALLFPFSWFINFTFVIRKSKINTIEQQQHLHLHQNHEHQEGVHDEDLSHSNNSRLSSSHINIPYDGDHGDTAGIGDDDHNHHYHNQSNSDNNDNDNNNNNNNAMSRDQDIEVTNKDRILFMIKRLWPYMIPLFVVYMAEYSLQSGVFAVIGFPVESPSARKDFYVVSAWMYQIGVLISRSSGLLCQPSIKVLWGVSMFQGVMLALFTINGYTHVFWNWGLLFGVLIVGLNGGFVYVWVYRLVNENVEKRYVEFSLAVVGISDTFGIILATGIGILLQGCLEGYNKVKFDGDQTESLFKCGYEPWNSTLDSHSN